MAKAEIFDLGSKNPGTELDLGGDLKGSQMPFQGDQLNHSSQVLALNISHPPLGSLCYPLTLSVLPNPKAMVASWKRGVGKDCVSLGIAGNWAFRQAIGWKYGKGRKIIAYEFSQ
jgi:hypothetical protein